MSDKLSEDQRVILICADSYDVMLLCGMTRQQENEKMQNDYILKLDKYITTDALIHILNAISQLADPIIVRYLKNKCYTGTSYEKEAIQEVIQWQYMRVLYDDDFDMDENITAFLLKLIDTYCEMFDVTYDKDYFRQYDQGIYA
jgi:hypothetical protein